MATKLTLDEQELLQTVLDLPGWKVALKVAEGCLKDIEKSVINYNLAEGPEGLMILKARAEGAKKLLGEMQKFKNEFLKS